MSKHNISHLYVTGDSFSFGQGLAGHDISKFYEFTPELRKTCYSGIIADAWNIPGYTNTSKPGCSNDRSLRKLMIDIPELLKTVPGEEIFVNVSITHTSRREFYSNDLNCYSPLITNFAPHGHAFTSHLEFWKVYVAYFDNVKEHAERSIMQILSMQNFLKSLNIRYVFTRSMNEAPEFHAAYNTIPSGIRNLIDHTRFPMDLKPFNIWSTMNNYEFTPCRHVKEDAHEGWANHVMQYLENNHLVKDIYV